MKESFSVKNTIHFFAKVVRHSSRVVSTRISMARYTTQTVFFAFLVQSQLPQAQSQFTKAYSTCMVTAPKVSKLWRDRDSSKACYHKLATPPLAAVIFNTWKMEWSLSYLRRPRLYHRSQLLNSNRM
jgi:hypothetical protein